MSPADPRSDPELVDAANAGDVSAFEALYRRYRDWVAGLAFRLCGSREDALDITQETFLWFMRQFPGFELRAKVKTVLYPVVRNLAIGGARKRGTARRAWPVVLTSSIPPENPADDEEQSDRHRALREVLAAMSENHREVLILRFVDGLSLEEISAAIEVPLGTVKSRLHHALRGLREHEITRRYFSD